jgi:SDR family mycofactocin-dependent oxidoreductase
MAGRVEGKVALVTGAAHGQGRSHALLLAEHGADVAILDICAAVDPAMRYPIGTAEELAETASMVEERDRRCVPVVADVRDFAAVGRAVETVIAEFGRIDIVVCNAGIITLDYFEDITDAAWDAVMDTNLKGVFNVMKAVAPHMKSEKRGGSIVITSSTSGLRGHAPYVHYVASKHGVVGLCKALANELAPWRIRVNTVHPTGVGLDYTGRKSDSAMVTLGEGPTNMAILEEPLLAMGGLNRLPDYRAPFEDTTPTANVEPIDISYAVLFLASDEARYITGTQLSVDAGANIKP